MTVRQKLKILSLTVTRLLWRDKMDLTPAMGAGAQMRETTWSRF